MKKRWDKHKALKALRITHEPFDPNRIGNPVHGYSYGYNFAINPDTPYPGAAGFHEMAHIVLGHTVSDKPYMTQREEYLHELEACATAIIALKAVGGKEDGIQAQREHYMLHRHEWGEMEGGLPTNFKHRVNTAAQLLLEAGRV